MLLERHQEVHDGPYPGASIGDVAGLDERGRSTDPAVLGVDQLCLSQDGHERIDIAVDVADRNDSARIIGRRLPSRRQRGCTEHQRAQDRDESHTRSAES